MRNFQVSARPLHSSARNVIGSPDQSPDFSPLKSWWFETVEIARQIERDRFTDVWNESLLSKVSNPYNLKYLTQELELLVWLLHVAHIVQFFICKLVEPNWACAMMEFMDTDERTFFRDWLHGLSHVLKLLDSHGSSAR